MTEAQVNNNNNLILDQGVYTQQYCLWKETNVYAALLLGGTGPGKAENHGKTLGHVTSVESDSSDR